MSVGIVSDQTCAKKRARGVQRSQIGEQVECESAIGNVLLFDSRERAWFRPMVNTLDAINDPMTGGQNSIA
jgi:hypothetical protein